MHDGTEPQHDTPRPPRSYPAAELRRALWLIFLAWIFGACFMAIVSGTTLTSFLTKYLHTDDFTYGLIMAAGPAAVLFFFLGSYVNERTGLIKRNFLIFGTLHRLLWLGVAAIPLLLDGLPDAVKIALAGACIFVSAASANFGGGGWLTWMSDIVPKRMAGAYFGNRAAAGLVAMVVTSVVVSAALDRYAGRGATYAAIFAIAAVLGAIDILIFLGVREIPRPVEPQPPTLVDILVTPWKHAEFRGYARCTFVTWVVYMMIAPFIWRFCFDAPQERGLGMSLSQANLVLYLIPLLAMALTSPIWGRAIDRFGPKPVLLTSSLGAVIFPSVWAIMHREIVWLIYPMALLGGLSWPGIDQTLAYMQVKGFPDARRTAYCATFQVVFGAAGMIGTALGGVLANLLKAHMDAFPWLPAWVSHYHPLFALGILLRLLVFLFLLLPLRLPGTGNIPRVTRAVAAEFPLMLPRARSRGRRKRSETS